VGSLASWIDVSHEVMKAMFGACLEKMEARTETYYEPREALIEACLEMTEASL
jgi:hypothetical protein